jgi:hypothetical protein
MFEGLAGEEDRKNTAGGSSYRNCHISQAVLREAVCQMSNQGLIHRFREQARSHRGGTLIVIRYCPTLANA